MVTVKSKLELT